MNLKISRTTFKTCSRRGNEADNLEFSSNSASSRWRLRTKSRRSAAFTLIETVIAFGLATLLMAVLASLSIYSARTFSAMSNYVDLDVHSRYALDIISREARQANAVVDCRTNGSISFITFTNVDTASFVKVSWNMDAATLSLEKTGQPGQIILTGCDRWRAWLWNRAPNVSSSNLSFNAAASLASCKVVNMSWKCSRTILGSKLDTESVQTAQIVLRNKVN